MDHRDRCSWPTSLDPRIKNIGFKRSEVRRSVPDVRRRGSVESATGSSDNCSMSSPSSEFAGDSGSSSSPGGPGRFLPQSCGLCDDGQPFSSELNFCIHLTITHFRKDILDLIKSPTHCPKCDFKQTPIGSREQQIDNMLVHVGCEDRVAIDLYKVAVNKVAVNKVTQPQSSRRREGKPPEERFTCELCSMAFPMERLFIRHLTLKHFRLELGARLPRSAPFKCPMKSCSVIKSEKHDLLLHYGCEHNFCLTLYNFAQKRKAEQDSEPVKSSGDSLKPANSSNKRDSLAEGSDAKKTVKLLAPLPKPVRLTAEKPKTCSLCPLEIRKPFDSSDSYKRHLFQNHFFPVLPKPLKCPDCRSSFLVESGFFNHFMDRHLPDRIEEEKKKIGRQNFQTSKCDARSGSGERSREDKSFKPPHPSSVTSLGVTNPADVTSVQPVRETSSNPISTVPKSRTTMHSRKGAESSSSSSTDRYRAVIEHLKRKLLSREEYHKEAIRKKDQGFERWITAKEKTLEDEADCRKKAERKSEDLQVSLLDRENEVKAQKLQATRAKEDLARSRKENSKLRKEKDKVEQDLSGCQVEVHCLKEENKNLEERLAVSAKEKEKLEEQLKLETEEVVNLKTQSRNRSENQLKVIKQLTVEKQALNDQISGFEEKSREQNMKVGKLQQEVQQLHNQLEVVMKMKLEAREDQSATEKGLNELRMKLKSSEQTISDKDRQIEALLKVNGDNIAEHKSELERMKNEVNKAENKLEAIDVDLQNARQQNRILLSENEGLSRRNKDLQNSSDSWQKKHELKLNEVIRLQMKKDNLTLKVQELSSNLLKQGTSESLTQKVENLKAKVTKLTEQLVEAQNNEAKAEARLQRRTDELKDLTMLNANKEEKIRDLEKAVRQLSSETDQLKAEIVKHAENDNAKRAHIQTSLQENHRKVTHLTAQVKNLEKENAALRSKCGETSAESEVKSGCQSSSPSNPARTSNPAPVASSDPPVSTQQPIPRLHIKLKPRPASKQRKIKPLTPPEPAASPEKEVLPPNQQHHPEQSQSPAEQVPQSGVSSSTNLSTQVQSVSPTKRKRQYKRKNAKKPKAATSKKPRFEDVIFEEDVNQRCGICSNYDPPITSGSVTDGSSTYYTTDWVGCDYCDNWYHEICTTFEKHEFEHFECSKLNLACQEQPTQ